MNVSPHTGQNTAWLTKEEHMSVRNTVISLHIMVFSRIHCLHYRFYLWIVFQLMQSHMVPLDMHWCDRPLSQSGGASAFALFQFHVSGYVLVIY